jgi:hypothetical protein
MKPPKKKLEQVIYEFQMECRHPVIDLKSDNTSKLIKEPRSLTHVMYCYICKKDLKVIEYE